MLGDNLDVDGRINGDYGYYSDENVNVVKNYGYFLVLSDFSAAKSTEFSTLVALYFYWDKMPKGWGMIRVLFF